MIKELISLANNLDAKGLVKEANSLNKVIRASLEDAPSYWMDEDLPSVEKHKETPFYYIKANRAIGEGDGAVFFGLQDSVYHTLKSLGKLSKESESPQGPFTAEDVRVIAEVIGDYLKKDFRSIVFPELGEDVKKMIGKEFITLPQEDWSLASTIIGFEIIKYNPILSLFGKAGEGERVGEISIDGQITLTDPESFGESFTEYLPGRYPASFYGSLRGLDPEVDREKIEQSEELWRRKTEEAKRRAIEKDFPPEEFREEGPVSDLEIPMGKEIELIENPEHYNFPGNRSMINRYKDDLEYGRSFRTEGEFPYEDSRERELTENYIDIYSSVSLTKDLVKLANVLDSKGLHKEADALDAIIKEAGFLDFLGFMLPEKSKAPEPKKNPHEIAVDRLDGQINLIKRKIWHLSQAGFDLTEDSQNEAEKVKLMDELALLEKRRDNLLEEYYHMMIPK